MYLQVNQYHFYFTFMTLIYSCFGKHLIITISNYLDIAISSQLAKGAGGMTPNYPYEIIFKVWAKQILGQQ